MKKYFPLFFTIFAVAVVLFFPNGNIWAAVGDSCQGYIDCGTPAACYKCMSLVCEYDNGYPCTLSGGGSGTCLNGTCCAPIGQSCSVNSGCCSGKCSTSFSNLCYGNPPGGLNADCYDPAECLSNICLGPVWAGIPGKCAVACTPNCTGKNCGGDGCGGICGTCTNGTCSAGGICQNACTPNCTGKNCGSDGCGGTCGTCETTEDCQTNGICCSKAGGACGDVGFFCCPNAGLTCNNYACRSAACTPATCASLSKNCGSWPDGCGNTLTCGTCGTGEDCSGGRCCSTSGGVCSDEFGHYCCPNAGLTCNSSFRCQLAGCVPSWQYGVWSSSKSPSDVACGTTLTETRTCTDEKSCGQACPEATTRNIVGTKCVSGTCVNGTCQTITCSNDRGEPCAEVNLDCCLNMGLTCNLANYLCYKSGSNIEVGDPCYHQSECSSGLICIGSPSKCQSAGGGPTCAQLGGTTWCDAGQTCSGPSFSQASDASSHSAGQFCCQGTCSGGVNVGSIISLRNPLNATSFKDLVDRIINFIFAIGVILAPLMYLVAGFYFVTAGGDPQKATTGKTIILYTTIGLGIILLARGLISVLRSAIGG